METNRDREAPHKEPAMGGSSVSPWITIPDRRIICIEHPAIIRNIDKGLATIGGEAALSKLAATNGSSGIQLRFRPDEHMQPPIDSRTVPSNNVLLKVTIRRKTERRNKDTASPTGETLLDKLRACNGNYSIEAVGVIDRIVRFRGMANYQWNSSNSPFVTKVKETLLKCNYDSIKNFEFNLEKGNPNAETLPPPYFTAIHIPFTYNYRQNPAIKKALIDGRTSLLNVQAGPKTYTRMITFAEYLPERPLDLRAYEELDKITKECVNHLHKLFTERPIWTRRALYNHFPRHLHPSVRFSMAHVAYMFRSGPWRDTCIVYGVDPRLDPKYRMYQSIFFQIEMRKRIQEQSKSRTSHIFDGKQLMHDGRCYQMCDIIDPMLMKLIHTENIREKCESQDGWYRASTMAKIKALMKAKVVALLSGTPAPDSDYLSIIEAESEDEAQETARKEREAKERADKSSKGRSTKHKRQAISTEKHIETPLDGSRNTGGDLEADDVGAAIEGDWEEELAAPPAGETVDEQVQKLMSAYLGNDDDLGFEEDDLREDFGILDGEDEEAEADEEEEEYQRRL